MDSCIYTPGGFLYIHAWWIPGYTPRVDSRMYTPGGFPDVHARWIPGYTPQWITGHTRRMDSCIYVYFSLILVTRAYVEIAYVLLKSTSKTQIRIAPGYPPQEVPGYRSQKDSLNTYLSYLSCFSMQSSHGIQYH